MLRVATQNTRRNLRTRLVHCLGFVGGHFNIYFSVVNKNKNY